MEQRMPSTPYLAVVNGAKPFLQVRAASQCLPQSEQSGTRPAAQLLHGILPGCDFPATHPFVSWKVTATGKSRSTCILWYSFTPHTSNCLQPASSKAVCVCVCMCTGRETSDDEFVHINSFIPVSYLALLPLIPMFLCTWQSFHSWVFIRKKSVKEGMWVWVICVCKLLVKPWQPIYHCVGKRSQKAMVTLSESLSPGGWHTGANKGDTYPF